MKNTHWHRSIITISRPTIRSLLLAAGAIAILTPVVATAQADRSDVLEQSPDGGGPGGGPPLFDVKLDTSFTAGGETEFRGAKFGDSSAFNFNLSASYSRQLNEKWSIPFELQSQNLALDSLAGVPLPDSINTLELGTGLSYRHNDRWMFMARISPVLYKFEDIGGNDIGLSGGLLARWEQRPSLSWMFGLMVQPDGDIPVIPVVGVDWRINEQWELQLMMLSPRVVYTLDDKWKLHAGMGLNFGTTFRTDDTLGTSIGLPRFNDALGSYSDMRFGVGASYQLNKSWSLEAEAGYSMNREIDYKDLDEKVKFDDAPYFRLGLKFEF